MTTSNRIIYGILVGIGSVGRNLLRILHFKKETLQKDYNIEFKLLVLSDSSGIAISEEGFNLEKIIQLKENKKKLNSLKEYKNKNIIQFLQTNQENEKNILNKINILFEATPVNLENGSPGLEICKFSLEKKLNIVLANKGPLVLAYEELHDLAKKNNVKIGFSATICGGLPIINIVKRDMIASEISLFRGIFNSTSNFILCEMEKGRSYEEALKEAQDRGIAETDPTLDVEGWDTANKLMICCNSILNIRCSLKDIQIEGITKITQEIIKKEKQNNKVFKLVGMAKKKLDRIFELSVKPILLDKNDFLSSCNGWEMGVEIHSDLYGKMYHKLWEVEPIPTSSSMIRDAVNIFNK